VVVLLLLRRRRQRRRCVGRHGDACQEAGCRRAWVKCRSVR
jgi:hypothetical protein